jgi:RNA polymerase sigma factor (sigma-70 family)
MPAKHASVRSQEERDALVLQYSGLPWHVVRRYAHTRPVQRLGLDDALQVAFLGLLRAAEIWQAEREADFLTYAFQACKSHLWRAIHSNNLIHVPVGHAEHNPQRPVSGEARAAAARARRVRQWPQLYEIALWGVDSKDATYAAPEDGRDRDLDLDQQAEVARCLRFLPPGQRQVVRLAYWESKTHSQIGALLGITHQAVQLRLAGALAKLRSILKRERCGL